MDAKRVIRENKKQAYRQQHGEENIKAAVEQRKITKEINKNNQDYQLFQVMIINHLNQKLIKKQERKKF